MDRIAQELNRQGFTVTEKSVFIHGFAGYHFEVLGAEFVYRMDEDDETVVVTLFRRVGDRAGLGHPWKAWDWFLAFLVQQPGIKRVKGLTRKLGSSDHDLSTDRLVTGYQRLWGGTLLEVDMGEEWYCLDLKNFVPMREYRRRKAGKKELGVGS